MLFAIVEGEKVEAIPKTKGTCQLCDEEVFSKCGEVNVWHWSHRKDESCDSWYEPETEWHKNWKLIFGKDNCEIPIRKNNVRHIADIYTDDKIVIELQNSPIQKPIIQAREDFYGERMMWIINGKDFKANFSINSLPKTIEADLEYYYRYNPLARRYAHKKNDINFIWSYYRRSWIEVQRPVFIDFGDENLFQVKDGMGTKNGTGVQVSKEKFIEKYKGNLNLLASLIVNSQNKS